MCYGYIAGKNGCMLWLSRLEGVSHRLQIWLVVAESSIQSYEEKVRAFDIFATSSNALLIWFVAWLNRFFPPPLPSFLLQLLGPWPSCPPPFSQQSLDR